MVKNRIELEQTFNFDLAQETPRQALMTAESLEMLTWKWLVLSRLDAWLARAWRSGDFASTLMCIKRGIHGGRSSDACARVSAVETQHLCDDNEAVVVTKVLQYGVEGMYAGARLYQVPWYREVIKERRDPSPDIETILSATEGAMIGGGFR
jgi:hypothetical protein